MNVNRCRKNAHFCRAQQDVVDLKRVRYGSTITIRVVNYYKYSVVLDQTKMIHYYQTDE